jgi:hypothetical protein
MHAGVLPANECPAWQGVECDPTTQRVISIDVSGKALPCDQNPSGCQLLDGIFSQLGLTALHTLNISHTSFAVDLDALDLSGMYMLRALDLGHMPNVVGSLNPIWVDWMPLLEQLRLAGLPNAVSTTTQQRFTLTYMSLAFHLARIVDACIPDMDCWPALCRSYSASADSKMVC